MKKNKLYKIKNNSIHLLKGAKEFEGVVFRFGQVKLMENNTLTYDWNVLDYNGLEKEKVLSVEFADIINIIIEQLLLELEEKDDINESNDRENNTFKLN